MPGWSSGLCDCLNDCGICCYGWFCTPCLYGENAENIDGSSCCCQCCLWSILAGLGFGCLVHMPKRETLRLRYGLEEDCNDCLATTFCAPCAICQEARELKFRRSVFATPTTVIVQPVSGIIYSSGQAAAPNMYPTVPLMHESPPPVYSIN